MIVLQCVSSIKYLYLPHGMDFFRRPPTPLEIPMILESALPTGNFSPFFGGSMDLCWKCTINHNWRISCKKGVCILLLGRYTPFLHEILQLLKPCWFQIQIKKFVVIFIIDEDEYVKKNVATLIREIAKHTPEVCYY